MSDALNGGKADILEVDSEGEDLPFDQVCAEAKQEDQEQPPPLYHQYITRAAQALGIEMPAERGRGASRFDNEEVDQSHFFFGAAAS